MLHGTGGCAKKLFPSLHGLRTVMYSTPGLPKTSQVYINPMLKPHSPVLTQVKVVHLKPVVYNDQWHASGSGTKEFYNSQFLVFQPRGYRCISNHWGLADMTLFCEKSKGFCLPSLFSLHFLILAEFSFPPPFISGGWYVFTPVRLQRSTRLSFQGIVHR